MNTDSELLTAVRESFAGARLATPLDVTIHRGRVLQARRWRTRAAVAVAIAGAAGLTAAGLASGGAARPAGPPPRPASAGSVPFRTAAWTVTEGPGKTVTVLIRELSDPAGLQRALRADGVPAAVAFQGGVLSDTPPLPRACRNTGLTPRRDAQLQSRILGPEAGMNPAAKVALTIHAAEIPKGIGLNLTVQSSANSWGWSLGLVQATPRCTGS
jgi:hypothetical protein